MELDLWMNKIQDRTQSWRSLLYKGFIVSVVSFHVYFDKQVHKKLENKISKQKKSKSLNFAESNTHRKTNAHSSFETYNLFLLALLQVQVHPHATK